jgi:hypothetical protein
LEERKSITVEIGRKLLPGSVYADYIIRSLGSEEFSSSNEVIIWILWRGHEHPWKDIDEKIREIEGELRYAEGWSFKRAMKAPMKKPFIIEKTDPETGKTEEKTIVREYLQLVASRKGKGPITRIRLP